jgi:Ca2+-binding EF-hand superfamily protein
MAESDEECDPIITPRTAARNEEADAKFEKNRISAQSKERHQAISVGGKVTGKKESSSKKNEKPASLMAVLAKAKHKNPGSRTKDFELNKRFMSTMFMPAIDTEAVTAAITDLDIYEYADNVSEETKNMNNKIAQEEKLERDKVIHEETLEIDRHGHDLEAVRQRPKDRKPVRSKSNRTNPTNVFPVSQNLPYLVPQNGSIIGTVGLQSISDASTTFEDRSGDNASITDATARYIQVVEDSTLMALPSVHKGITLTVPVNKVDRYFGKDARSGFFDHYRSMSDSNLSFAHVKMTRNENDQWISTSTNPTDLQDEDSEEECAEEEEKDNKSSPCGDRSGWDGRLNSGGSDIGILNSPKHTGRDVSPSSTVAFPRGSPLGSPRMDMARTPLSPFAEMEAVAALDRLDKSSLWTNDAVSFHKTLSELDATILSGTQHGYFDHKGQRNSQIRTGSISEFRSLSETLTETPLMERLHSLKLPSISNLSENSETGNSAISPRTKFIAACIDRGLRPLPSLVMRKNFNTKINLSHFGIGDSMGCAFAECLLTLPSIESIDLCDNNLTDISLFPLITACSRIKGLQELNLSRNKIDAKASKALATYMSSPMCPLYRLVLDASDVDDSECAAFVECLGTNRNLHELDMSNNLLGNEESIPGSRTGGAALADFLVTPGCKLNYLKLAWNGIRQETAKYFAYALGKNTTLTYIDLSYNGLGFEAGEILGDSIIDNKTLKTLILDNNNFGSTACVTICIGVCQNMAIQHISLDENPIGEAGAKMIMQVPMLIGNRVDLTARNCNTVMRDERCWYDLASPCRAYSLDLTIPFERAVAFSLLQVVASHSSYIIAKSSFQEDKTNYDVKKGVKIVKKFGSKEEIQLFQGLANDKEDYFDDDQRSIVNGLRMILAAASNSEKGKELFEEADLDGGGDLDREELEIVMKRLGLASEPEKMAEIFALFDLDGTGVMTKDEFLDMLKAQSREAAARVKEMTTYPVLCLKEHVKKNKKYIPPRAGMLHLTVVDGFDEKENFAVLTKTDQDNALGMALKMGDSQLINEAIRTSKIRYTEGVTLFKRLFKETGNMAQSVARLLPQMKTNAEAKQLVSKITGDDRNKVSQIKQILGAAAKTIFGMYNGFYALDLSKEYDRVCLSRLFEQSSRFNSKRAMSCWLGYGKLGDTSQHGNWSSFRNEFLNKVPIEVTPEKFTPMPQSGILEFDFSGSVGPTIDDKAIPDNRLCNVMYNLYLLKDDDDKKTAESLLGRYKREICFNKIVVKDASRYQQEKALRKEGQRSVYECPRNKSLEQGIEQDMFYDSLPDRRGQLRDYAQNEVISVNFAPGEVTADDLRPTPSSSPALSQQNSRSASPSPSLPGSPVAMSGKSFASSDALNNDKSQKNVPDTIHEEQKGSSDGNITDSNVKGDDESVASIQLQEITTDVRERGIQALRARLEALIDGPMSHKINDEAKSSRFCEVVEETFSSIWLDCRQVCLILQNIPYSDKSQSLNFGSYAVNIAVSLFGRIVDPHNVELIIRQFNAHDAACFWCRIGFLNLFNSAKPEGTLELNLARREESIVARMLIYLSIVEPGDNCPQPMFKWKREMDATPGFEITAPWATLDGLPTKGNLGLTFYSGGGEEKDGCKPNKAVRRALMQMLLVDENHFDKDPLEEEGHIVDLHAEEHLKNSAKKVLTNENARKMWNTYIWPGCLKE